MEDYKFGEPLTIVDSESGLSWWTEDSSGEEIIFNTKCGYRQIEERRNIATNFCAGVPTSALEAAGTGGLEELVAAIKGYFTAQAAAMNTLTHDAEKRELDLCANLGDLLAKLEAKR